MLLYKLDKMSSEVKIKITLWNCRGLRKLTKVKQVMNRIKSMQSNIVFLQETHLMYNDNLKIRRRWKGKVFSASFNSQARGVCAMVHESIPLQVNKVIKDKFGQYLIIPGNVLKEQTVLANIYAPNTDDHKFVKMYSLFCPLSLVNVWWQVTLTVHLIRQRTRALEL